VLGSPNLVATSAVAAPSKMGAVWKSVQLLLQPGINDPIPPVLVMMPLAPTPLMSPVLPLPPLPLGLDDDAELAAQAKVTTGSKAARIRRFMGVPESKIPMPAPATSALARASQR
jgi:hypothetical protein